MLREQLRFFSAVPTKSTSLLASIQIRHLRDGRCGWSCQGPGDKGRGDSVVKLGAAKQPTSLSDSREMMSVESDPVLVAMQVAGRCTMPVTAVALNEYSEGIRNQEKEAKFFVRVTK